LIFKWVNLYHYTAAKIAKLQKPPYVEAKVGHMVQRSKPSKTISDTSVEWNQELTFIGVDPDTTPRLELTLCGISGSIKSKIQSKIKATIQAQRVNKAGLCTF
jgi:hypothetical protein